MMISSKKTDNIAYVWIWLPTELFGRMSFNILCGNTDDHARNHAAFWDGNTLSLTRL